MNGYVLLVTVGDKNFSTIRDANAFISPEVGCQGAARCCEFERGGVLVTGVDRGRPGRE